MRNVIAPDALQISITTMLIDPNKYAPTRAAAAMVGKQPTTLRQWRLRGTGPQCFRIGGRWLYPVDALADWVRQHGIRP